MAVLAARERPLEEWIMLVRDGLDSLLVGLGVLLFAAVLVLLPTGIGGKFIGGTLAFLAAPIILMVGWFNFLARELGRPDVPERVVAKALAIVMMACALSVFLALSPLWPLSIVGLASLPLLFGIGVAAAGRWVAHVAARIGQPHLVRPARVTGYAGGAVGIASGVFVWLFIVVVIWDMSGVWLLRSSGLLLLLLIAFLAAATVILARFRIALTQSLNGNGPIGDR